MEIRFIDAEEIEQGNLALLENLDGICVPGGFGSRGIEGMIIACRHARENRIPYLGICLGSQIMGIEYARNILGIASANSEEFVPENTENIIHIMETQKGVRDKGGTMRLGTYPCVIRGDSLAFEIYKETDIHERHRHRFEFNNAYRERMESAGFHISGTSPDGELAEIVEISEHPFMIGTQFHPEFKSRPTRPHPLFLAFVEACEQMVRE